MELETLETIIQGIKIASFVGVGSVTMLICSLYGASKLIKYQEEIHLEKQKELENEATNYQI